MPASVDERTLSPSSVQTLASVANISWGLKQDKTLSLVHLSFTAGPCEEAVSHWRRNEASTGEPRNYGIESRDKTYSVLKWISAARVTSFCRTKTRVTMSHVSVHVNYAV